MPIRIVLGHIQKNNWWSSPPVPEKTGPTLICYLFFIKKTHKNPLNVQKHPSVLRKFQFRGHFNAAVQLDRAEIANGACVVSNAFE